MYGVRGNPERSNDRFINKIFDHGRKNTQEAMTTNGCDLEFAVRDLIMGVGTVPRGDFRGLEEQVAIEKFYKIMNINLES